MHALSYESAHEGEVRMEKASDGQEGNKDAEKECVCRLKGCAMHHVSLNQFV